MRRGVVLGLSEGLPGRRKSAGREVGAHESSAAGNRWNPDV